MHLVEKGFFHELMISIETGETSAKDSLWWSGYALGLFEAGYLTQKEHDAIVNEITRVFKGGE